MQSLRCLVPSVRAVVMMILGVAACPLVGLAQTAPSMTAPDLTGSIIATHEDRVSVATGDTVILDQGRWRGVQVGDRYAIFQPNSTIVHPVTGRLIRIPPEAIGELAVVNVAEQTSTALLLRSTREVNVGALVAPLRVALTRQPESRVPESRVEETDLGAPAQERLARLSPCLEAARQAVQEAENAGGRTPELADAKGALASAEHAVEQANALLAAGEAERAAYRLDNALADCLRAEDLARRRSVSTASREPVAQPERYMVRRGETLWGMSAREQIYNNPFMWPLIYKANAQQIRDPDLIFPRQIFVIPRDYTPEEAAAALYRARHRGAWRVGDGR
jgi:hypothetical protein